MNHELFDVPDDWWHRRRCQVCGGALSVTCTHTYVVQRQGWVKIGASSNLARRVSELRRPVWTKHLISPQDMDWDEPLIVHGVIEGDVEHQLHQRFAAAHITGEWFMPNAEMRSWLTEPLMTLADAGPPTAVPKSTRVSGIPDSPSPDCGQLRLNL